MPEDLRKELDGRLVAGGFSGYRALTEWLRGEGFEISVGSVIRHGRQLETRIAQVKASTDAAVALVEASPDDEGAMSEATLRLVQQKMFDLLLATETEDLKAVGTAATALAKAARANIAVRNARAKAMAEAAGTVRREAEKLGLSEDVLDRIDSVLMPEAA